jgi:Family of unknown function (DUF6088)
VSGISDKIMARVRGHGRGRWVFEASDFLDIEPSRGAIQRALGRLAERGDLRRVGRGVYDFPRFNKMLNRPSPPDLKAIISWLERKDGVWIVPDNIVAANRLGLTDAVPARLVFYTNGPARKVKIGGWPIQLMSAPKDMRAWANSPAVFVIQALKWLGRGALNSVDTIQTVHRLLSVRVRQSLAAKAKLLDGWMAQLALAVAQGAHA